MVNSEKLWTGKVPDNWKFYKGKYVFGERSERGNTVNLQLLSPTQKFGVIPQSLYDELTSMKSVKVKEDTDLSTFKTIHAGDFCISLRSFQGGFEYSEYEGVVSPAYRVLYPKVDICAGYYKYLFKEQQFIGEMNSYCQSLRDGKNISYSDFGKTLIPYPPLPEQQAIADYLDEVCSKIDEIIAEAKASIEEYKELKQAVIFEAVTKGLDRNVEIKDVNIEYLESCPMDWHILPISMLFDFFGGFAYKSDRFCEKTNNQVVRLGNVKDDELRLNSNPVYVSDEYANASSKATIKVDDILFTMTGTRGKGDYFYTLIITENDLKDRNLLLNQRVGCFRKAYHTVYMPYYNYLLKSSKIRERVFLYETGTANQGNIGIENINRIRLYNPPMEVQKNIVITLKHKCSEIDSLITEKEALIADLEAYKKSLIYELVTGKRRVV